jgi:hypothetical protein
MAKQVTKTPQILAQMQLIAGEGVDVSNLPVFEAVTANTLPISKRGSIYNKAKMSEGMLSAITDSVNANGLPLHTLHQQGTELPAGRVFSAGMIMGDTGLPQVNMLFWVDPAEADLVAKMDTASIDSVSLGVLSECALCSECGFDFFGADASAMAFWDRTCANDHVIGENGVHLNLTGLDVLFELSAVSTGAVKNSKIVAGSKAKLSDAMTTRLAASGLDASAVILHASSKLTNPTQLKEPPMADAAQFSALIDKHTAVSVELAVTAGKLGVSDAKIVELSAQIVAKDAEIAALVAAAAKDPVEAVAKLATAEAEIEVSTTFLRAQAAKALSATNKDPAAAATMTVVELTGAINDAQATLATLFPAGGKSLAAGATDETTEDAKHEAARRQSFKSPK